MLPAFSEYSSLLLKNEKEKKRKEESKPHIFCGISSWGERPRQMDTFKVISLWISQCVLHCQSLAWRGYKCFLSGSGSSLLEFGSSAWLTVKNPNSDGAGPPSPPGRSFVCSSVAENTGVRCGVEDTVMPCCYGCHHQNRRWAADLPDRPPKETQGQVLFAVQENHLGRMSSPLHPHQPAAPDLWRRDMGRDRVRSVGQGTISRPWQTAGFGGNLEPRQWSMFCSCSECSTAAAESTCRHAGGFPHLCF